MADQTTVRPINALGGIAGNLVLSPTLAPIGPGIAAATVIWSGEMVGLDASGNMVSASAATCITVLGIARATFDNRTTGTPPTSGLAGAISGTILNGPYSVLGDGSVVATTPFGSDLFVVDNQTVSTSSSNGARLRAGYFVTLDPSGNPICQFGQAAPIASSFGEVASITPVNGAGGVNVLTPAQSQCAVLILASGATAGFTITVNRPAVNAGWMLVRNNTGQTATIQFASGTGTTIATTVAAIVYSDGTNAQKALSGT
jgi:hypothetical protein